MSHPTPAQHSAAVAALFADLLPGLGSPLSAEQRATIAAEEARLDAQEADRATRSTMLAHVLSVRASAASAARLVDLLDADPTSTLAERDRAAMSDARERFRLLAAEHAVHLVIAETTSGRRIEPARVAYAVETLRMDAAEAGGYAPSTLDAIEAAAHRAAALPTRTRFER